MEPGAHLLDAGGVAFAVWAPGRRAVEVEAAAGEAEEAAAETVGTGARAGTEARPSLGVGGRAALGRGERGWWTGTLPELRPGSRYRLLLDGEILRPDPASHYQPKGVHGPSEVVDHGGFAWEEGGWPGLPTEEMILYELHVGTFTPEGTFGAAVARLPELVALGVTAVELMPVAQFPGDRNWGYDGACPYAVQASYGGPTGFKELVAACHRHGLAVVLDVVYNHLGPEGNYLRDFGPFFTDRYRTPWGEAINFDGPGSDEVREYFIGNAMHWFRRYHVDALRLDAVHAICDSSARPFLAELAERTAELSRALGRPLSLIAESDLNDSRVVRPAAAGGLGMQAQWSDDLHHALHALLTGEREGYYRDFGSFDDLVKAYRDRFVYDGGHSLHRQRRHGNRAADLPPDRFVVFSQNHDQVGNRLGGERTSALLPFEALKLLAASILLSPYVPLLFMGEEYGEPSPFQYFVSHTDPQLVEAVRRGRREEFAAFAWAGEAADPQDPANRDGSVLRWELRSKGRHGQLLALYRALIALRREHPALRPGGTCTVIPAAPGGAGVLALHRHHAAGGEALAVLSFEAARQIAELPLPKGRWDRLLDSEEERWGGSAPRLPQQIPAARGETLPLELPGYGFGLYERGDA